MTSEEALEIIVRKHCVSNTDKEDKELEECYKSVKEDLELLEILKKHLRVERLLGKKERIVTYTRNTNKVYGAEMPWMFASYRIKYSPKNTIGDFKRIKQWIDK